MKSKIRSKYDALCAKIFCGLTVLTGVITSQVPVIARAATPTPGAFDWILTSDDGTLDALTDKTKALGGSGYNFLMVVGAIGVLFALILLGFDFLFHKNNATKKDENKSHLVSVAVGGLFIFGALFFAGLIKGVADGL